MGCLAFALTSLASVTSSGSSNSVRHATQRGLSAWLLISVSVNKHVISALYECRHVHYEAKISAPLSLER